MLPLNPIARWEWVFPVVESLHLCGLTLLIGMTALLDLRLMGIAFERQPVSRIARDLAPWIAVGLIVQLVTGPYLFSGDPREYLEVEAFRNKMLLLALALAFHFTVIRRATSPALDAGRLGWRRPAAALSLGLWLAVALAGLWIGNL